MSVPGTTIQELSGFDPKIEALVDEGYVGISHYIAPIVQGLGGDVVVLEKGIAKYWAKQEDATAAEVVFESMPVEEQVERTYTFQLLVQPLDLSKTTFKNVRPWKPLP